MRTFSEEKILLVTHNRLVDQFLQHCLSRVAFPVTNILFVKTDIIDVFLVVEQNRDKIVGKVQGGIFGKVPSVAIYMSLLRIPRVLRFGAAADMVPSMLGICNHAFREQDPICHSRSSHGSTFATLPLLGRVLDDNSRFLLQWM